jgi:hypothetical protein
MEVFLFFGAVVSVALWFRFYRAIYQVQSFRPNKMYGGLLAVLPGLCLLLILAVLWGWGSPDVRSDAEWIALHAAVGAAWLQLGLYLLTDSLAGADYFAKEGCGFAYEAVQRRRASRCQEKRKPVSTQQAEEARSEWIRMPG